MARLVAFDLDDTLAPSKSPIPPEVARALLRLLDVVDVCVISGGQWAQFDQQVIANLPASPSQIGRLHLMPTCGTRYLRHDGEDWYSVYERPLTIEERSGAIETLTAEARRLGLWETETWGDVVEDRGSQITFSALGQAAPVEAKRAWDPTGEKRSALVAAVAPLLPHLEVRSGGSTSVDITRKGIDKAYGMRQLAEETGIGLSEMLFIGDRLDPEGNDYPVKAIGVPCVATEGPAQTVEIIDQFLQKVPV